MRIPFTHSLIAYHPNELTVPWAQRIVKQHSPDTIVQQVQCISIDTGTTTRVQIKVDHNGPESLSRQWFVKIPSLSWRARAITALPRLLQTEIRFYNELAQHTPVTKPIHLSARSRFGLGSTLVLTNISEQGCIPGDPGDVLSKSQAMAVIEQLACLHAKFWNLSHQNLDFRWLAGPIRRLEDNLGTALAVPLMKRGLKKAGIVVPKDLHSPSLLYAHQRKRVMKFLSQSPQTIIHHDCHPGNLFWQNTQAGLLDWQMVRIGEGVSDLAYFIATSLEPEIRRTCESQLIEHYIQSLAKYGVQDIVFKQTLQRYRAHLIYPFEAMIVTLAVGGMMNLEANLKLIGRTASAIEENDAFSSIPIKMK